MQQVVRIVTAVVYTIGDRSDGGQYGGSVTPTAWHSRVSYFGRVEVSEGIVASVIRVM